MKRYTELKRFIRQSQRGEWCGGRWVSDVEEIETLQGRWCLISRDRGDNKAGLDLYFYQICILQKKKKNYTFTSYWNRYFLRHQ